MNARDILEVADNLCAGNKEAEWRSGVSRAYYAAFHTARLLLKACSFKVPNGDQAHGYLWLRLCNAGQPDIIQAGKDLSDLRGKRNWADYNLDRPMYQADAIGYYQAAEKVIQLLE